MRILIVDDAQSGDDLAHHLKTMYGAEVFRAQSPKEALRKRSEITGLNFIVFDLSYPDSTREESINCIPQLCGNGVDLFVYTGYSEKELMEKSLEAGARDWYVKGDNERGGSALAARMASSFYRSGKAINGGRSKLSQAIVDARTEQASNPKIRNGHSWFSTAQAVVTIAVLVGVQLIGLGWFIFNQVGANALFRDQVARNTVDVTLLKQKADEYQEQSRASIQDRLEITRRLNDKDRSFEDLRKDMNAGFTRIYDVLLQDRQTKNAKNGPN